MGGEMRNIIIGVVIGIALLLGIQYVTQLNIRVKVIEKANLEARVKTIEQIFINAQQAQRQAQRPPRVVTPAPEVKGK